VHEIPSLCDRHVYASRLYFLACCGKNCWVTVPLDLLTQLEQAVVESFTTVDQGHAVDSLSQLTADFAITSAGQRVGRPQYDQLMATREKAAYTSRHVPANFRVAAHDQESFQVDFVVVVHRTEHATGAYSLSVLDFCDTWVRDDAGALLLRLRQASTVIDINAPTSRPKVADLPNEAS
jgi:lysine/ornithine N-monooxygenase